MNEELKKLTEQWGNMERDEAQEFYDKNMMKLVEAEYLANNADKVKDRNVDYLVLTVGTSYEPLVLNIQLLKPKEILFLYTSKTGKDLNKVVSYCGLDAMSYAKSEVDDKSPLDIYREIKKAYLKWGCPNEMYIDFTGGTKAMSAAAAMAGAIIDVQSIYVSNDDYLKEYHKPNPGSERLYFVENPIEIFGDLEIEKAYAMFGQFNFIGAKEKLGELIQKMKATSFEEYYQLSFAYDLAEAYENWDVMDFAAAYASIRHLTEEMARCHAMSSKMLMMDFQERIAWQAERLKSLSEMSLDQNSPSEKKEEKNERNLGILKNREHIVPLTFTMYMNAETRYRQKKYDMATLLLYRLLEMMEQRRLALYGLDTSDMKYENIAYDFTRMPELKDMSGEERLEYLKRKVNETKKSLYQKGKGSDAQNEEQIEAELPEKSALMDGYILLKVLNDELFEKMMGENIKPIAKLRKLYGKTLLRNNGIFAHGLGPVSQKDFEEFREFTTEIFEDFCTLEDVDFDRYKANMEWLDPSKSIYYAGAHRSEDFC